MSIGFSAAISGLQAAQAALQTIGHNVANQGTKGYSRQDVLIQSANPLSIRGLIFGSGVKTGGISRTVDTLLIGRLQSQTSLLGYYGVQYSRLSELESFLNEPTDSGLGGLISKYFGAVSTLSAGPEDTVLRQSLLSSSKNLTQGFNQLSSKIFQHRTDLETELTGEVGQVNQLAKTIAALNGQVLALEGGTSVKANDTRDQRDEAIRQLSELVGASTIEDANGTVRVSVGGYLLVSTTTAAELEVFRDSANLPQVRLKGTTSAIPLPGGKVGGLLGLANANAKTLGDSLDTLAYNLILEVNRHHSTGIGKKGSYTTLTSTNAPTDTNGNGNFGDELLTNAGLPFAMQKGDLYINVVNQATGDIETSKISIDPATTTLTQLATKISAIPNMTASVDGTGRIRISGLPGYAFDFAPRLDANPNTQRTFGAAAGTVSSTRQEPFALANGDTLSISINGAAPVAVSFLTANFADITKATAAEVAARINSVLGASYAKAVDGRVVISSLTTGSASTVQITDGAGTPAADMGLSTALDAGDATGVTVAISGAYTGSANDRYTFKADNSGTIGLTAGLAVGVFNSAGTRIATLDVSSNYTIGAEIQVANGVKVAFGAGSISSAAGDFTYLEVLADSDTADVLPSLGINSFFKGSKASDIALDPSVEADPDLIAASLSGSPGDNGNLLRILGIQTKAISNLGSKTLEQYYGTEISKVGFDAANAQDLTETQQFVVENLEIQRLQVSGVSVDEEMTKLLQFQQMFEAVSRYISVLADLERNLIASL